jgi:hypothetical protein
VNSPPEVADLDSVLYSHISYKVEEDVFWLDVPVDDFFLVNVVESLTNLSDDGTAL